MRLTVLGTGTSVPSVRRGSPAALVECGGARCLVDSGPGALRQLARAGVSPHELTDLLYTHAHPDHTADLWPFLFLARIPFAGRAGRPLRLHGSPGFFDFYRRVAAAFGSWAEPAGFALEEVLHLGQEVRLGAAAVSGHPVPHIASSIAYRFEDAGRRLVVSGDTDLGDGVIEAARGAHVLLLECASPDGRKLDGHLTPALCAEVAAAAGVERLVLTHFYPEMDLHDAAAEVRKGFAGEVIAAEDFLAIDV